MIPYPPPGRLVDIGGRRLHIYESGEGSPTVVLESGLAATSLSWRTVQNEIAKFTRVISYDRAGLGWSDSAAAPPTLTRLTADLRALLQAAGHPPPYILAAHSFGALIARCYAGRYRDESSGLVLVDPLRLEEWRPLSDERRRMLARGARLSRRGAFLARTGLVRWCLQSVLRGSRWLPRAVGAAASGKGAALMNRLAGEVGKMPPELWPMVASHWSNPKSFLAMAAQLEALPGCLEDTARPDDVPTIELTAAAAGSGHWVHLDQPELVVDAVRQLTSR